RPSRSSLLPYTTLFRSPSISFARSLEFPLISLHAGSTLHDLLEEQAAKLGRVLRTRIQVSSYEAVCRMIVAGVGVAILPETATQDRKSTRLNSSHVKIS